MTETRKQIIELIGDYMDKTLSFGCYVEKFTNGNTRGLCKYIDDKEIILIENGHCQGYNKNELKIIGHYDITAVLKYVEERSYNKINGKQDRLNPRFNIVISYNYWYIESDHENIGKFDNIEYPLKPIHLYTEQEEKELLELLLKLK